MTNGNGTIIHEKKPGFPVKEIAIVIAMAVIVGIGFAVYPQLVSLASLSTTTTNVPSLGPSAPIIVPSEKVGTVVEENADFRVEVVKEAFIKPHPTQPDLVPVVTNVKFVKIREGVISLYKEGKKVGDARTIDIRVTFSESDALGLRKGSFFPRVLGTDHLYEDFYNPYEVLHHNPRTIGGKQAEFRLTKGSAETYFVAIIEDMSSGDFNSFYSYSPTYKVSLIS